MTIDANKAKTLMTAGKNIAAIAAGRALKGKTPATEAEELLADPAAERQDQHGGGAEEESRSEPGNPNDLDHRGK